MAFIYKITNNINGKCYIGKTLNSIEKRWKEHCNDANRLRCEKRPLYSAIRKYGEDNFSVEKIEECNENFASDREIYWIDFYDSFRNGYNATRGGDGKKYIDYDLVVDTYLNTKSLVNTANALSIHPDSVYNILKSKGVDTSIGRFEAIEKSKKPIDMYSIDGIFISFFDSAKAAGDYIGKPDNHISSVCTGNRKSAYGFIFRYKK